MKQRLQWWSLLALITYVHAYLSLPYEPTRLLRSTNSTVVYIFQNGTLQAIDLVHVATAGNNFGAYAISSTLPFIDGGVSTSYTPIMDRSGNITVVAGDCSRGPSGTKVWQFARDRESSVGNGTWAQFQTSPQNMGEQTNMAGANYLSNGAAFSTATDSDTENTGLFLFGGMCPSQNSTEDTWTRDAVYSDLMLAFSQGGTGAHDTDSVYNVNIATSSLRGPPVAEAGFSMTGLEPSYTYNASGASQVQEQDFLLVGGHTSNAFLNMSQVALYSLPQQSWTYFPVDQPLDSRTDLTVRQAIEPVEPRSGHTAVLSEDGNSIIVFGGWVGDISNPAQPQLAVLHLGAGYGGNIQDWSWSVPEQSGPGLETGAGVYGHGATMLPGDVMMVLGGYSIPAVSSSRVKRAAPTPNTIALLYNTSSNSWISSYSLPTNYASQGEQSTKSGALSKVSQQAGLGIGLGVGAIILIALIIFYFWYTRRLKRIREERERALLTLSSDGSYGQQDQPFIEKMDVNTRNEDAYVVGGYFNDRERVASGTHRPPNEMESAGSTGLFVNIPSPTRGLRKGAGPRPYSYHAAPRYDDKRMSKASGIHPIVEHEDEDGNGRLSMSSTRGEGVDSARRLRGVSQILGDSHERTLRDLEQVLISSLPGQDPFRDPRPNPLGSHPVSPVSGETVRHVSADTAMAASTYNQPRNTASESNWVVFGAENVDHTANGRVSPTRTDDRTSSTLSERSQRSQATTNSITRTMSTRTGALLAAAFAARRDGEISAEASGSSSDGRTDTMSSGRLSPFNWQTLPRSATLNTTERNPASLVGRSMDSFATAKTSFAQLQTESDALLGGRPTNLDRDDPYQRALAAHRTTASRGHPGEDDNDSAPYTNIPTRRRPGWMGSLRRALTAISNSERSFSLTTASAGAANDHYENEVNSRSSSPIKHRKHPSHGSAPRRAVSDGGTLLRQKRGEKDWDDKGWIRYRDDPDPGDWGPELRSSLERRQAEEDWDVEGAANKRDFQVIFTIPKTRLRVVNADLDRASLRSASDSTLSRAGSVRTGGNHLRGETSMRSLRRRSDEFKSPSPLPPLPLSATQEEREDGMVGLPFLSGYQGKGKNKAA